MSAYDPNGTVSFYEWSHTMEAREWCGENPDEPVCQDVEGRYHYDLTQAANVAFLVIFSISLLGFIGTFALTRRAVSFTVCICLGVTCEVVGYIGRIMGYSNPWAEGPFLMQFVALTIGPAFMAAGIYLCLRRIVTAYGQDNSWIRARSYTMIFVPFDIISLILQAIGGGRAGSGETQEDMQQGSDIMTAGLGVQVSVTVGFMIAVAFFMMRTRGRKAALGEAAYDQTPSLVAMRSRFTFKAFMYALALSTVCILMRSIFRLAELANGWGGWVMQQEDLFIGFEGVLIVVAMLSLNFFNPAICLGEVYLLPKPAKTGRGPFGLFKREKQQQEVKPADSFNNPADSFDNRV